MHSHKHLAHRIDKLEQRIPSPKPHRDIPAFTLSFFTEDEQRQLTAFLTSLTAYGTPFTLSNLSDEDLDEYRHWLHLELALSQGDMHTVETLRRRFATSLDELITRFLAIDVYTRFAHIDVNSRLGSVKDEDGVEHALYKAGWNNIALNVVPHGRVRHYRDDLWMWVEWFESLNNFSWGA